MARIRPTWTPDGVDNPGAFVAGFDFSSDIAITVSGLWWYQVAAAGPASVTVRLYDQATQTALASGTGSGLTAGTWNLIPFSAPFSASAEVTYTAAVELTGAVGFQGGQLGGPIVDPTGHVTIPANGARFKLGNTGYPGSTWDGMHGTDIEFTAGGEPATGTLDATLPALAADITAAARATGVLTGVQPALTGHFTDAQSAARGSVAVVDRSALRVVDRSTIRPVDLSRVRVR